MNDNIDPELDLDEHGVCNHCRRYEQLVKTRVAIGEEGQKILRQRIVQIKERGRNKDYDVVIGVSGGTDSTYVALKTKQLGLRPLAVHVDNGWNSDIALGNMQKILQKLEIDVKLFKPNLKQFRDLQLAFLKASTPDGEIPSDHAIQATLWKVAESLNISTIVSGMNFSTEAMSIPNWSYGHSDWRYIKDVHRRYGSLKLDSYPHYSLRDLARINAKGIRTLSILNYEDYNKSQAQEEIRNELGWEDYGGKHHESVYTRFFQGVVLPEKFGIDKRYAHFSDLINAGQMTRQNALAELKKPTYDHDLQDSDRLRFQHQLGLSDGDFEEIMAATPRSFRDFKNSYRQVQFLRGAVNRLRALGLYDF